MPDCQEPGCRALAVYPTTAPSFCAPHNDDTILRLRRCYQGLADRIFSEDAPDEWNIPNRTTRSWVKGLMGAALDAAAEIYQLRARVADLEGVVDVLGRVRRGEEETVPMPDRPGLT